MRSVSTARFCKLKTCPSAERLLAYHAGTLTPEEAHETFTHLAACDFCDAEITLLAKCLPERDSPYHAVEMPASLRLLAKTLLSGAVRHAGNGAGNLYDRERLTLTDA